MMKRYKIYCSNIITFYSIFGMELMKKNYKMLDVQWRFVFIFIIFVVLQRIIGQFSNNWFLLHYSIYLENDFHLVPCLIQRTQINVSWIVSFHFWSCQSVYSEMYHLVLIFQKSPPNDNIWMIFVQFLHL